MLYPRLISIRVNSPLDTTGCENSTARTLEEKTRIYSHQSSTIVPGLVLPAQLTESFYKYERWAMSNDDQMMMNPAHGLAPDDGHEEDLTARRQEEMVRYWSRSEHSRLPCRGAQALVDHQWSLTTNCGTRGWLGKVSLNSIWMQVEMILYLACITRSGTCSRRWRSVSPNKPGEQKIMK